VLPKGTHHYETFIRPSELRQWASTERLTFLNLQGITYRLFKNQFELCDAVDVNYLMCFKK